MGEISGVSTSDIDSISGFFVSQSGSSPRTTTPTISVSGGTFGAINVTVTNHSSAYTNPNYSVSAVAGGTTTVDDSVVDRTLDSGNRSLGDSLIFNDTNASTATRTVSVRAQEFGDSIQSEAVTATYDVTFIQNRYLRVRGVDSSGSDSNDRLAISDLSFYTSSAQSGTEYPTTAMTSNISETGIRVSQGHVYSSTYAAYKAVDSSTSSLAWLLGTSAANNWWQIEWESLTYSTIPTIKSARIKFHSQNDAGFFKLEGSDNGRFQGEETDYGVFTITAENTHLNFG